VLGVSTVMTGLMAGLFWSFDMSVMPGLSASDDRTFVTAMQNINAAIENGLFALVFGGAFLFPAIAAVLQFRLRRRGAALWTVAALACYTLVLLLTMGVEVPLNNQPSAGDPIGSRPRCGTTRGDVAGDQRYGRCTAALAFLGRAWCCTPGRPTTSAEVGRRRADIVQRCRRGGSIVPAGGRRYLREWRHSGGTLPEMAPGSAPGAPGAPGTRRTRHPAHPAPGAGHRKPVPGRAGSSRDGDRGQQETSADQPASVSRLVRRLRRSIRA
jgi:uncharacterized membrane protein